MSVQSDVAREKCFSSRLSNFYCRTTLSERLRQQTQNNQDDFFHQPAFEDFHHGFSKDILNAVRKSDVEDLRRHHAARKSLRVRNAAGESLLHVACRCQSLPVVEVLISEAGIPVHVCDMYGRTPLHDSTWVGRPNFHIADLILEKCPDLLLIKDQRGHTPLCYA
eukprot:scaffold2919_cov161-Amphora_coffeaeformis.AAC.7